MVAEGIRLHALEVEEFRHTFVVALEELLEDRVVDGTPLDLVESPAAEEVDLEGEAEEPGETEVLGPLDEPVEDAPANAEPRMLWSAPQPMTAPSTSAMRNSCTSS